MKFEQKVCANLCMSVDMWKNLLRLPDRHRKKISVRNRAYDKIDLLPVCFGQSQVPFAN